MPATGARHACRTKRSTGPGRCTGLSCMLQQAPCTAVPSGTNAKALNLFRQMHLHLPAPSHITFPASVCLWLTWDVPPFSAWAEALSWARGVFRACTYTEHQETVKPAPGSLHRRPHRADDRRPERHHQYSGADPLQRALCPRSSLQPCR